MAGVYRPRRPERTVLYRVLFYHFEREHGFFRPIVKEVVERYLDCGNPRCGFRSVFKMTIRAVDRHVRLSKDVGQ
jgi:hypothetical protein